MKFVSFRPISYNIILLQRFIDLFSDHKIARKSIIVFEKKHY